MIRDRCLRELGARGQWNACWIAFIHVVSFQNCLHISRLIDVNQLLFPVSTHLNSDEVLKFTEILHFILLLQCRFEIVYAFLVSAEDDKIIHPYCQDNSSFAVEVDAWVGVGLLEANRPEKLSNALIPNSG